MRVYTILVAAILTLGLTGATIGSANRARAEGSEQTWLVQSLTLPASTCTPEDITFTGTVHMTSNVGDNGHQNQHYNAHLEGLGATSGDRYLANEVYNIVVNDQGAQTYTVNNSFSVNSPGSGRMWEQSALVHITTNDQGDVTSYVTEFVDDCH